MKMLLKSFVSILIISSFSVQLFSQQSLWNVEREANERMRRKIDSLKIHEVKAFQYVYNGGKKSSEGEMAEHKIYNRKGYVIYEYSTIDHDLSYILAQKCIKSTESFGEYQMINHSLESLFMLPSAIRFYTYSKDTLVKILEAFPIDGDTAISMVTFAYNIRGNSSVQENVFTSSPKWMISTSRDLYLNSKIPLYECGPWIYNYDVAYSFNNSNDVWGTSGTHATRPFYMQYIQNKQGRIEKAVGYYNGSYKVISKHLFEYDANGNVILADIEDAPGHIQIRKKYDVNNNVTEYERIQVEDYKKAPGLADARYRHCFYKYDNNGLLKERIDVGKAMDTLCTFSYRYWFDNDFSSAISEKVNAKIEDWKVKGKYESTQEHSSRITDANIKKQSELFKKDAINEIGQERYDVVPIKMEYNADTEHFTLTFEELDPIDLYVPRGEAEEFETNANKYTIYPQFEEGKDGLILKSVNVKSTEKGKEYKSVNK